MRQYDKILAISVVYDFKKTIDTFFLLSVDNFNKNNFLFFTKESAIYNNARLDHNKIEATLLLLIKQIEESSKRFHGRFNLLTH